VCDLVKCKLLVHPTEVENAVDLADQVVGWHHLVEIKGIKELALSVMQQALTFAEAAASTDP
jgi:hypothetical protein